MVLRYEKGNVRRPLLYNLTKRMTPGKKKEELVYLKDNWIKKGVNTVRQLITS